MAGEYRRVKVLIETAERSFRGMVFVPSGDDHIRLSDFLNTYDKQFLCLADVELADRGQHWRIGDKTSFVAIAVNAITYIMPMEGD